MQDARCDPHQGMSGEFHGSFVLVLHAHMPHVLRHDPLEEDLLYEAVAETYIPLLDCFGRLADEGVCANVTIGLTPVLAEQLADPHFVRGFREFCQAKTEAAAEDERSFRAEGKRLQQLAGRWQQTYREVEEAFVSKYEQDLVGAFRRLQDDGQIEIMTSAATHAYLPGLLEDTSIQAQIKAGVAAYERHFGRAPQGCWLPECGYRPAGAWRPSITSLATGPMRVRRGIEEFLSDSHLRYFVIDQNQLAGAMPRGGARSPLDIYRLPAPTATAQPVSVFVRDAGLSAQVWEAQDGYPGDGAYLEFHRRHGRGRHRYWKITDRHLGVEHKEPYCPDDSFQSRVPDHAGHYKWLIAESLKANFSHTGRAALAMTAFDAELLGHWWHEGPLWLYYIVKWVNADPELRTATCSQYLAENPPTEEIALPGCSWGHGFDHGTWINQEVEWTWERIYHAEQEVKSLMAELGECKSDSTLRRILAQAVREFLVLQASDWQFMITNWRTRDHAEKRVVERHEDFKRLAKMARRYGQGLRVPQSEWAFLRKSEDRIRLFPDLDLDWLRSG